MAEIINFYSQLLRRKPKHPLSIRYAQWLHSEEVSAYLDMDYHSMDDLPAICPLGQYAIRHMLFPNEQEYWYACEEHDKTIS